MSDLKGYHHPIDLIIYADSEGTFACQGSNGAKDQMVSEKGPHLTMRCSRDPILKRSEKSSHQRGFPRSKGKTHDRT
jgi:hypothetical protein